MLLSPTDLAALVSSETGLSFSATGGKDGDGQHWVLLHPTGLDVKHTFGIRITIGWRRVEIGFEPGAFAAPLLGEMGAADAEGRVVFASMLSSCQLAGAELRFRVNGQERAYVDPTIWTIPWTRLELLLRKGNLEIGDLDAGAEIELLREWALRFAAAIIAILPLDGGSEEVLPDNQQGFPEGAATTVTVNRYERDRRNRAAAIAIHGVNCKGCGMSFSERYGDIGFGFIEIHHVVPVSKMPEGYMVDPVQDLVPLCSNCHSVVHRVDPPMSVESLQQILLRPK
jgi:5-methylcytosine-specific restriction protein A